jgi:plasmid maintenance system antidote protein VapI
LAEAVGVQRKHVNELCNDRRNVTAPTALILGGCSAIARTSGLTCGGETI